MDINVTEVPNNTSMIPQILDLFNGSSNITNSNTSSHETVMKNPNKALSLIFICGIAFVILICCIVAKSKKNKKDDNSSDLDDSYNWDSMDDSARVRTRDEKMYDHKFTCHDHKSHFHYEPQLHGGHYDLNRKKSNNRSDHEYEKVNSGGGTM